ncbi:MAG: glycosyltransferase family 39 protein [Candidatus Hydrogenedentes bacterium]|nr:glycosyltransferase family 39 protein [Candidatus Hydrogenedentota bacterium]
MSREADQQAQIAGEGGGRPAVPPDYPRLFATVAALVAFICAAFTAVASAAVWLLFAFTDLTEEPAFLPKLAVKAALFLVLAGVAAAILWRLRHTAPPEAPQPPAAPAPPIGTRFAPLLALAAFALLLIPNLDRYPHAMPDEIHHLIVARNLAEHGLYASGRPDTAFKLFDDYDSVGPPVLVPVAAAFRVAGTGLVAGRTVMAVFSLLFLAAVYAFCAPLFGRPAAVMSALCASTAWGSVYLGRTLYGEVPALLFLVIGLTLWRTSISGRRALLTGTAAGLAFGLAILCKNFMILSAWAFLGALVYDRLSYRRIGWRHIVSPALGTAAVVAAWPLIQSLFRDVATGAAWGQLSMYRHNLLFGLDSAPVTLGWLARWWAPVAASAIALLALVPTVFRRRYDPAAVVLVLFVSFQTYWWVFFTTGNIPRYLWYATALGALFTGAAAWRAFAASAPAAGRGGGGRRAALIAAGLLLLAPSAHNIVHEAGKVYGSDEMHDDRVLAEYVRDLPEAAAIASPLWDVRRALDFLADRHVQNPGKTLDSAARYDVLVVSSRNEPDLPAGLVLDATIGRYAVFTRRSGQTP